MSTNTSTGRKSSGASVAQITHHVEPAKYGGETYARCEGCGRESVNGENSILHTSECSRSDRQNDNSDTPRRSEPADFGHGETTGVQDL